MPVSTEDALPNTPPPRIVVIEDNEADIRLLRLAFDEIGEPYTLTVLRDGEEAMRFVEHEREGLIPHPCLIILDLHLPRYDGLKILNAIAAAPGLVHLKVAVITSLATPRDHAEVLRSGVCMYAQKPADLAGMLELGRSLMSMCLRHIALTAGA